MSKEMTQTLEDLLAEMRVIDDERDYYGFTISASGDGTIEYSVISHWEGFADEARTREIRAASIVVPRNLAKTWLDIGEGYWVVNKAKHLFVFFQLGGHVLVERGVGDTYLHDFLMPRETVRSGEAGFLNMDNVPKEAFNRAPSRKLRMQILKRDDFRCVVCGRRPVDYTDVELHVHHIRLWGRGGLTEGDNLLTLCQTCHGGLDPHEEYRLFQFLRRDGWSRDKGRLEVRESVRRYRNIARQVREQVAASEDTEDSGVKR